MAFVTFDSHGQIVRDILCLRGCEILLRAQGVSLWGQQGIPPALSITHAALNEAGKSICPLWVLMQ